jgi:O-succinylhomoserine sulfhydrylase
MDQKRDVATLGVRAGQVRSQFQEHSEALYLTSSFVFDNAAQAAARFAGEEGMVYTRYTNPTVAMFQDRLAALEGGESCVATSSGMSAILATAMVHLKAGDHVVCSNAVFGATIQLFTNVLGRFGIETSYVSPTRASEWEKAVRKNTRLFFLETPSNPLTEVSDIRALSKVAKQAGALLAVDNVFCTPVLQRPLELGADLVVHSATKYLDGQGRVMGGAVVGAKALVGDPMTAFLRTAGPALSPFNAWVLLKGLETLAVRVRAQTETAGKIADALAKHPKISRLIYPGRSDHPQAELVKRQMRAGSTLIGFEVKGGKQAAFRCLNGLQISRISNNLGDAKSLVTHPATTTHQRFTPDLRLEMGIRDGLVRFSVGLEHCADLREDLERALAAV